MDKISKNLQMMQLQINLAFKKKTKEFMKIISEIQMPSIAHSIGMLK